MIEGMNLHGLMEAFSKMQGEVKRAKEALEQQTVTGETGGGMVQCVANGRAEILSLSIDPTLVASGDKKMIEDLTVGAVNLALERAHALAQESVGKATLGLSLPPGIFPG